MGLPGWGWCSAVYVCVSMWSKFPSLCMYIMLIIGQKMWGGIDLLSEIDGRRKGETGLQFAENDKELITSTGMHECIYRLMEKRNRKNFKTHERG